MWEWLKKTFNTGFWMHVHRCAYTRLNTHVHIHTHMPKMNNLNITRAEHYQKEEPQRSNGKKKKIKSISSTGVLVSLWPIVNWLDGWVDDRQTDRKQAGR